MNPSHFSRPEDKRKVVLPGGTTLLSQVVPEALSISVGVWVRSGSRHEDSPRRGITHFLEHMVFKGTEKRSAFDIALSLDRLGGQLDAFTTKENTCYNARVLAEYFDEALDVLADLLLHPQLEPQFIEMEKRVVLEEIQSVFDDPDDWIHDLASEEIFGEHPMARPILGDEETVRGFTRDDLRSWMAERYLAEQVVISVAGPLAHDDVRDRVEKQFDVPSGFTPSNGSIPILPAKRTLRRIDRPLQQQHLWLGRTGMSLSDPDRYAMLVLNTILGGSMSSRLFQSIREKSGLAYAVFSYADFASDTGTQGTYMAVSPARSGEAVDRTLEEFSTLVNHHCEARELEDARMQLKGNMLLAMESIGARMARMAKNELSFGRFLEIPEIVERIDAVSLEDLQRIAAEYLDPAKQSLLSLGPSKDTGSIS